MIIYGHSILGDQAPYKTLLPLAPYGSSKSFEVQKKSADPDHICMVVSQFFENPIQNVFSEIERLHRNPPSWVVEPNMVAGYMRKQ